MARGWMTPPFDCRYNGVRFCNGSESFVNFNLILVLYMWPLKLTEVEKVSEVLVM